MLIGGNGTWKVLSREPMLASRVYRRVRLSAIARDQIIDAMPAFHALYAGADPQLLGMIDDLFGHGSLRNWAAFTHSASRLLAEHRRETLDEQITRNVFALHGGGTQR